MKLTKSFVDDIRAILKYAPWGRQTALFSATMPDPIKRLAEDGLHAPRFVDSAPPPAPKPARKAPSAAEPSARPRRRRPQRRA